MAALLRKVATAMQVLLLLTVTFHSTVLAQEIVADGSIYCYYAHTGGPIQGINPGVWVEKGQKIATSGDTGYGSGWTSDNPHTAPHLHFACSIYPPDIQENRLNSDLYWDWIDPDPTKHPGWTNPLDTMIETGSPFGEANPAGNQKRHNGRDYSAHYVPLYAVAAGEIVWTKWWPSANESNLTGHGITIVLRIPPGSPSVFTMVKEVVVKTAPKAVGPGIGIILLIVVIMGISGFKKNPIGSIKQVLYLISKVHGYWARRKLLRELNKAREKHGLVRVSLANLLVLGLICAGFYSVQLSTRIGACEFTAPLDGRIPSRITSTGLTYSGEINELIPATSDGKVVWTNWWPSNPDKNLSRENFGQTVVVQTNCGGSSWYVYYGNLSTINVKVGQNISIGNTIGQFGMTGAQQVQMHYAISAQGPTETHLASDWENVFTFTATRMVKVVTFWNSLAQWGLKYGGYAILIFALIMFFFTGQSEGIIALIRRSILPGFFFAALALFAQLGPTIGSQNLTWPRLKIVAQTMVTKDGPCQVSSKFPEGVLRWCNIITAYANQNGLDPNLVAALIMQESSGNPDAYSGNGAVGLMQVMPSDGIAAEQFSVFKDRPTVAQLKNPDFNVEWGTRYLGNLNKAKGSIRDSLFSYGPSGVGYYYADIVLGLYNTYK